ncbi:MAG: hypothetical protein ITG02_11635 [Patulibacter sp.]|nr:hypothetical protein [Patulibacter sp.]
MSELVRQKPSDLLAAAWSEYVERHRAEFASDLSQAAELVRSGSFDDLVDFAQDAHHAVVSVDVDALIAAWDDPEVRAVLDTARSAVQKSRAEGRRIEL